MRTSLSELVTGIDLLVLPKEQIKRDDFQKVRDELLKLLESLGILVKGKDEPDRHRAS